jgi:hypothetical protein
MSHPCVRPACPVTVVDDDRALCRFDLALVPKPVREALTVAYDRGRGLGTPALKAAEAAAVAAAERAVAASPAGRKAVRQGQPVPPPPAKQETAGQMPILA